MIVVVVIVVIFAGSTKGANRLSQHQALDYLSLYCYHFLIIIKPNIK
jgi:hypothetical protein